ncbi:ATPase associated with various cellular activities AAA_3 [Thermobaculum terrenum ATCC BAA-798]|uniref:ATPase associated with various cellular activities AAA_3 n=1 Tax=Thermobaculum terrenum (strain ATCC BAA-798 / CCMEE 7001 / YNP1) TaxID=525904 RepID=D1CB27_THET1|nr:ATPase associated with various cellular activities AAA_3 [Thermobaculum terrenum ATCC BAA-798]
MLVDVASIAQRISENIQKVILGKKDEIELAILALLSKGHILLEDVPGVGKTVLAKSLAASLGCSFKRIQFTPDLLPSDVIGVSIYNQKTGEFEYRPGPIIAQVVLADEINRATPKTQSALLEAMEEKQVTVDGVTHSLPEPFLVIATENPIEYEGTFPLPEAQLDRFLIRMAIGYPDKSDEISVLESQHIRHPLEEIGQVVSPADILEAQEAVKSVYVDRLISEYIVNITSATREHPDVYLGASPRGSLGIYRVAQARAAISGRDYVIPDDVKSVVLPVLSHRIILNPSARMREVTTESVISNVLESVTVPGTRSVIRR